MKNDEGIQYMVKYKWNPEETRELPLIMMSEGFPVCLGLYTIKDDELDYDPLPLPGFDYD